MTNEPLPSDEATVRAMLAATGIAPSEQEIATFTVDYPKLRAMADLLHADPASRYESPGLHFDPTPAFVEWA